MMSANRPINQFDHRQLWCMVRLIVCAAICPWPVAAAEPVVFERHVAGILRAHCSSCHGSKQQEAGLRLDTAGGVHAGSESGPVVIGNQLDQSLLWTRIHSEEMPPESPLPAGDRKRIREWILAGGRFQDPRLAHQEITSEEVTPILLLRCTACHGARRQEAGLDLRTRESILKGGKSGPAALAGNAADSLMVQRIHALQMPPPRLLVSASVKPMLPHELRQLEAWINAGLPQSKSSVDPADDSPAAHVTDDDRMFWAFQPPQSHQPPSTSDGTTVRNPVDAFVYDRLSRGDRQFAPPADRATLCRRVTLGLTGLPPTPDELQQFLDDRKPGAYERLVDRLLSSPHYGVRWARHWLDVAGYADSEGAQNEDRIRPHMWRYRDYVIRSFNADKTYDRFLHEQIAGDEMVEYERAEHITSEIYDQLVATGFLRCAPDRTFQDITNFVPDRLEVIADELQVLGSAVLGLTIHCARCHDHKFDPISQRDYYRLAATFGSALDPYDWLKPADRTLPQVTTEERLRWQRHSEALDEQIDQLRRQSETTQDDSQQAQFQKQIERLESQRKPEPRIRALWARSSPSPTFLLKRGNHLTPGRQVGPGVLSTLTDPRNPYRFSAAAKGPGGIGRRLELARWLTQSDHPTTARVIVNRLWLNHFGVGLVATPGNFGRAGARPSHPELLDWLATELVRRNWSLKSIHRLIVTSHTYRQSSEASPQSGGSRHFAFGRAPLRRMDGETIRDSLLSVAGQLDRRLYGTPDSVEVRTDGLVTSQRGPAGWRRSVFVLQRRTKLPTILDTFDAPQQNPNCVARRESVVATQALHLLNNQMVYELAGHFAERVRTEAGSNRTAQIQHAAQLAYGRSLSEREFAAASEQMQKLEREWARELTGESRHADLETESHRRALHNLCHAMLNSASFLFIE